MAMTEPISHASKHQPLIGTAWLVANWPLVVTACIVAIPILYIIARRWLAVQQRNQALFDFTLAETLRKQDDSVRSLRLYDKLLYNNLDCPAELVWRCYYGRAACLLARRDAATAMKAIEKAITAAEKEIEKREERQNALERKEQDDATSANRAPPSQSSSQGKGKANVAADQLDSSLASDPFIDAPISLAPLYYQRALILDALTQHESADADYERALQLDPNATFVVGMAARRRLEERTRTQHAKKEKGEDQDDVVEEKAQAASRRRTGKGASSSQS